jgi:hypothetical protein
MNKQTKHEGVAAPRQQGRNDQTHRMMHSGSVCVSGFATSALCMQLWIKSPKSRLQLLGNHPRAFADNPSLSC